MPRRRVRMERTARGIFKASGAITIANTRARLIAMKVAHRPPRGTPSS
jgi:hypothetical protein